MVMASIASKDFNWQPNKVGEGDDPRIFMPDYFVVAAEEAKTSVLFLKSKFADLPTFGLWADRTESDDELLGELGSGWRGFATEQ